jgi:hypothetical protein
MAGYIEKNKDATVFKIHEYPKKQHQADKKTLMCYQTTLSWLPLQQSGIMRVLILLCHQGMVAI